MSKLKIAHVAHSVGGVDVYIRLITKHLNDDKFINIIIHGKDQAIKPYLNIKGNSLKDYSLSLTRNISLFKDFNALFNLIKILKKERPDIIHAHSAKGGVIGRIAGIILGIPVIFTPHAFSFLSTKSKLKRRLFLLIEKALVNKKTFLVATSDSEKILGINEVKFLNQNAITFNNCIEKISIIKPLTISKTWPDHYICTVGRPSYQKNIELMVRVMSEVNKVIDLHLVIMGVGHHVDQLNSVNRLIKKLKLENKITLLNWTEQSDIFNIIHNCKFYISTARYEGMPYSVIESIALSKPCIVSDCDGNRDIIKHMYNGFIIQNDDIERYKYSVLKLYNDKELYEQLSKNAYESFLEKFNIENNIHCLEKIYVNVSSKVSLS